MDFYLENPKGFRIYNKINNCHRTHNDLTPSGQIIRKRWSPDGTLVDVIRFKDDGTKIVEYKYKLNGNWKSIDHFDNVIWNRVYE